MRAENGQDCVECGRPVVWDDAIGDYRHTYGEACAMARAGLTLAELRRYLSDMDALARDVAAEYLLVDLGYVTTDDGPYATLTDKGRATLNGGS